MTAPRVILRNNGRIMGGYARPGLVIDTGHRAVWIPLDQAHALADAIHDAAEEAEAREDAARALDGQPPRRHPEEIPE